MYQVERDETGLVSVTFADTVSPQEVEAAVADAYHLTMGQSRARLLLRFRDARLPGMSVLRDRLSTSPHIRPLIGRVDRAAVVTDQLWVRTVARAQALMFSRVATRDFPAAREDEARAYLHAPPRA
jgi:hypothetical protein